MKKISSIHLIVAVVFIVSMAVLYHSQRKKSAIEPRSGATNDTVKSALSDPAANMDGNQGRTSPEIKTFAVAANNFSFSIDEISVKLGDTVKIVLENHEGLHDLAIEGYNVATRRLESGEIESVQFIADKAGRFEYYCSVGTHRQMGMKGTLVVSQ